MREFENWLIAGAESLQGQRGLGADLTAPVDPEAIRGAKQWLSRQMPTGMAYSEVVDQPALTSSVDLTEARARCRSLDKCWREVCRLLDADRRPAR